MTVEPVQVSPARRSQSQTAPPIPLDYNRLEPLYEIQAVLSRRVDLDRACEALLPIVTRVLPVRTVVLVDTTLEVLRARSWIAPGISNAELEEAHAHARSVLGYLVQDDRRSEIVVDRPSILVGGNIAVHVPRHFVTLPLVLAGDVFGVFQLEGASAYTERDLLFINVLVNQLAVAIDRHHVQVALESARSKAERATRQLRDLQVVSEAALVGTTLDESLGAILHAMRSMFTTDAAAILLVRADGKSLQRRSSIGLEHDADLEQVGAGAIGRIAAGTTAICLDDLHDVDGVSPTLLACGLPHY